MIYWKTSAIGDLTIVTDFANKVVVAAGFQFFNYYQKYHKSSKIYFPNISNSSDRIKKTFLCVSSF